jgi:hypothetical protein
MAKSAIQLERELRNWTSLFSTQNPQEALKNQGGSEKEMSELKNKISALETQLTQEIKKNEELKKKSIDNFRKTDMLGFMDVTFINTTGGYTGLSSVSSSSWEGQSDALVNGGNGGLGGSIKLNLIEVRCRLYDVVVIKKKD